MKDIIDKFKRHLNDTGSSEVQIVLVTHKIQAIADHVKSHPKDFHCKRGLMISISRRKSLLAYLKRKNEERYKALIKDLGLRH